MLYGCLMSGSLREAKLTTRNAREALPIGLHWRQLDSDIHLGYRKGRKGGRWLVRWYIGNGNYHRAEIGVADDILAEGNLSYEQAIRRGRDHVAKIRALEAGEAAALVETVRSVVETYIEMRDARHRAQLERGSRRSDASSRLTKYVLNDPLADTELASLSEDLLCQWKGRLNPELSPNSRVRTMSDFKAALNLAHRKFRKRLPADFADVIRCGLYRDETLRSMPTKSRENQILSDDTVRDIIEAAADFDEDGDVGRMVIVLAATGARFSQVRRLTVGDVQPENLRLFVPKSRKGRGKGDDHYPVQVGRDVIDALRPVMRGRSKDEPLLSHWRLVQVKGREWRRDRRGPWTAASELSRQWRAICAGLGLEKRIVPYSLRHSSIVRAIRSGLPIRLVAAMHDTSVAMIERHYARYIIDGLEELAVKAVVPLVKRKLRVVI